MVVTFTSRLFYLNLIMAVIVLAVSQSGCLELEVVVEVVEVTLEVGERQRGDFGGGRGGRRWKRWI
jgi:hypothetical protein